MASNTAPISSESTENDKTFKKKNYTPTTKAYKNVDFLNSNQARLLRIMCEYEETMIRLKTFKIRATVLVFGSARAKSRAEWKIELNSAKEKESNSFGNEKSKAAKAVKRIEKMEWMGEMTEKVTELARLITEWGMSDACDLGQNQSISGVARYHYTDPRFVHQLNAREAASLSQAYEMKGDLYPKKERFNQGVYVCTGGGPGFMEAANKGAAMVPGAKNLGMGITLPFEEGLNEFVTQELAFEFHYFFTRKFWMVYHCQALVAAPGGFGTLDELFEVLTLKQTGKIQKNLPVILFGEEYWKKIVNWEALVEFGTVSQEDYDSLYFTDDSNEAFEYLVECLTNNGNSRQ